MMDLFDEEQIMKIYAKDLQKQAAEEATKKATKETAKKTARKMIAKGKMSLEEVGEYVPDLTMDELREIEAEVMELA
jgi:polyhydroxyalkanoate synthesis regulator phasin